MSIHSHGWRRRVAGVLLGCFALVATSASAQITGVGASGHIDFKSGFAPFNAPFGFVTTGVRNVPPGPGGGLFLQRWHLSPDGYAEGGTGLRIFNTASSYLLQVPVNTYLLQRRNACFAGAPPAELFIHWDAQGAPPGAAVDQSGLITWTPAAGQAGTFNFAVTVSDNQGGTTMQPVRVTVSP